MFAYNLFLFIRAITICYDLILSLKLLYQKHLLAVNNVTW